MSEPPPRRPVLHLKSPPALKPLAPVKQAKPAKPPAPIAAPAPWTCKPCGAGFDVPASLADEDAVRCPKCNARLGRAAQFRSDPPDVEHVRARFKGR